MLLSFIFLFGIGEAFMGKMSIIFYKEVGFSNPISPFIPKGWAGWSRSLLPAGSICGGAPGVVRALFLAGLFMAGTNILFSVLAWTGKVEWLFALAVLLDDLAALSQRWCL